ncbi:MAG: putative extracellular nuclease [Flavobacteriaceae bacterium]|jgi:predicted extracellular nuclease|uniref:endonuclease/exonuclease/phosphatase family protein n=1 Tax=Candidatus Marifrigoribacter sp. Uisw_064 TaxID=3230970 RepID=UPI003AED9165
MDLTSNNEYKQFTIAFYNLENLFDTVNDNNTLDDDFTESSDKNWNEKRFRKKVKKLGGVISQLGYNEIKQSPALIGVAEVENRLVLEELINSKYLKKKGYNIVHFDSPDERGIDTALLYREEYFKVLHQEAIPLFLNNKYGERDYTRDILYVKGHLEKELVHVLVNHWPSRRAGTNETSQKRIAAADKNRAIISDIILEEPNAKIIVMGDFNDDPTSKSLQKLSETDLHNPMEQLHTRYEGSLNYKGSWNLFDQILMSNNFLQQHGNSFRFQEAKIFNPVELQENKGRYKGNPFRTYVGDKYLGGFSDHFPVYSIFSIKNNS